MAKIEEVKENNTTIRIYEEDKAFLISKDFQKFLIIRNNEAIMKQEEIMHYVKIEMENLMNNKKK